MTIRNSQSKVRKTIAWSLRHVHKLSYKEVGISLGVSTPRARHLVMSCEAIDLRRHTHDVCEVFRTNAHIKALGRKFVDEVFALNEALNGENK